MNRNKRSMEGDWYKKPRFFWTISSSLKKKKERNRDTRESIKIEKARNDGRKENGGARAAPDRSLLIPDASGYFERKK